MPAQQNKYHALSTVTQKVAEIKSCVNTNRAAFGKNSGTIELLLDSILIGIAEDSADIPKLKLIKQ